MKYFEQRLDEENIKSKKIAWLAFGVMTLIAIILSISIILLMPLKMTEVKILVVDKNTGYPVEMTDLARFATGETKEITGSEALNKYFAQRYIIAHDSYNYYAIREAYATVRLYSNEQVFEEYTQKFNPPIDIEKQLGRSRVLEINILSMNILNIATPFKTENDGITLQARVEKQIRAGEEILSAQTGTITMTFGYDTEIAMDERARNLNPFGFTVTSYQFTPDQITGANP